MERGHNALVPRMYSDFILRVDDDEEPSKTLWDDLTSLDHTVAYSVPVVAFMGRRLYPPSISYEVRLFPRTKHRFAGGLNSEMIVECPIIQKPLDIIWHYALYAPREWREAKAERQRSMGLGPPEFTKRYLWEEHADEMVDMPEGMEDELPDETLHDDHHPRSAVPSVEAHR
jgi:hypothetical protein